MALSAGYSKTASSKNLSSGLIPKWMTHAGVITGSRTLGDEFWPQKRRGWGVWVKPRGPQKEFENSKPRKREYTSAYESHSSLFRTPLQCVVIFVSLRLPDSLFAGNVATLPRL